MCSVLRAIPRRSILAIERLSPGPDGLNGFNSAPLLIIQISTRRTAQNALSHRLGLPGFRCQSRLVARRGEHCRDFISLDHLAGLDGPNLPGLGDTQITNGHLGEGF